tara:strand:+ start:6131 stop:6418 length:288 start_codon:yes stop_codon:yes gene_type:complete
MLPVSRSPVIFKTQKLSDDEHRAIRSLYKGDATEHQQRLALKVIINKISRAQDLLYIPGSFDESAFLNGRAFVGQQLLKYLNLPVGKIEEVENHE